MAKHDVQLLLLFILLISTVGWYCAFSKQVPEEEGLSKLKMIRNLKGNEYSTNKVYSDSTNVNEMKTIFDDILKYSTHYADRVRQMCEGTDCMTVNDPACVEAGKDLGSTATDPICGSCDVTSQKCTYVQAAPEVVTELEPNQEDLGETTDNSNEVSD